MRIVCALSAAVLAFFAVVDSVDAAPDASLATLNNPMRIVLDARKAPLGIAYSHMTIPVAPGTFTLDYPQWIPGEHGPTGPLVNFTELRISADGKPLHWERDQLDMYAFHVTVPAGVHSLRVDSTILLNSQTSGTMATRNILVGNWNRYLLYQRNVDNSSYFVKAEIIMPPAWDYASALPLERRSGQHVEFATVSLETLVDSPTDMGQFYRHITTWSENGAATYLDLFADAPEDLQIDDKLIDAYKRLTPEMMAFYGGRHWNVYHAELTLSDAIGIEGIEHHQSSDNRTNDDFMTDPSALDTGGDLIPHEFSHSWNGKYRRPFDLQQPNYNEPYPEHTELLWEYEGLNQYIGDMLSFRSGIRDPKDFPEYFANLYAFLAYEPGRKTTPLIDLTTGAPYYFCCAAGVYSTIRRTAGDFYNEGEVVWLDADTIIREQTHGTKSIDDYAKIFAGGTSDPSVVTYTRENIEEYLGEVAPYDWHGFFQRYVYSVAAEPPTDLFARAGYKLVYNDTPNRFTQAAAHPGISSWYDTGLSLMADGTILDVREDSPAWNAGLAGVVQYQIAAVNGRAFGPDVWRKALTDAKTSAAPIHLIVRHGDVFSRIDLPYHDGIKFPHLERIPGTPDMLNDIVRPHSSAGLR